MLLLVEYVYAQITEKQTYTKLCVFTARCYEERVYCEIACRLSVSVCLSVRNVKVPWSHRLEYFENNFTAE